MLAQGTQIPFDVAQGGLSRAVPSSNCHSGPERCAGDESAFMRGEQIETQIPGAIRPRCGMTSRLVFASCQTVGSLGTKDKLE